jgi:hypothetical protein
MEHPDARRHLSSLVGQLIYTLTGRPNRVLRLDGDYVIVATGRSPQGQPVPIGWVQDAMDRLYEHGELEVSVPSVGYRSAFIGAVLATLPGAVGEVRPRRVVLRRQRPRRGIAPEREGIS